MAETAEKLQMKEKCILLLLADILCTEDLLTIEEKMRLQQRISKE